MSDTNWKIIFTTTQPIEAEIVKQMLESNSIEAVIMNQRDSSYLTFGEVLVYVDEKDAEAAKKLIKDQEI